MSQTPFSQRFKGAWGAEQKPGINIAQNGVETAICTAGTLDRLETPQVGIWDPLLDFPSPLPFLSAGGSGNIDESMEYGDAGDLVSCEQCGR